MQFALRTAAAALVAVVLAPAAAHAQQPNTVTFSWEPKAPTTLDTVMLSATTVGGIGTPTVTWDFDGDGVTDATGQQVQHKFPAAGDYRTIVKATWAGVVPIVRRDVESITVTSATPTPTPTPAATASPTATPAPPVATPTPAPACQGTVTAGRLRAASWCFSASPISGGTRYTSTFPISINGIGIGPLGGKPVTIDVTSKVTVAAENAKVYFRTQNTTVQAYKGKVAWTVLNDRLSGFGFSWGAVPTLGGMRITGLPQAPQLLDGGVSRLGLYLALPSSVGGGTSAGPVNVDLGGASVSGLHAFTFKVPYGGLPGINLRDLIVSYDGNGLWDINAGVRLPQPLPLDVGGDAGIRDGQFDHLSVNASYGANGPHLGPVTLKRLSFTVQMQPKVGQCVPKIGKETIDLAKLLFQTTGQHFNIAPVVIDHGYPLLALCGNVSITAGPTLLGSPALALDGGLGLTVFGDRPSVFRAYGTVKLVGMTLANADLEVHSNGYLSLNSNFSLGWSGIATLKGSASVQLKGLKFNGEIYVNACLDFVHFCTGAHGLVSSKGIAVCLNVDTFLGDWHPGFGDKWGSAPKLYFTGCDVGPYKEAIAASASDATKTVRIGHGLPGATIVVTGRDAAPKVAFVGPHGERIETPSDLQPLGGKGYFLLQSPAEHVTEIALAKPSAGTWRVEALPGSSAITRVESADGLPKPSIHASVSHGRLHYRIKSQPGQVVRFSEKGASASGPIGTAHGALGTIRFAPAAGKAERRQIVALVEQDGHARAQLVAGHYRAPAATRPAAVTGLRARRSGSHLVARWRGAGPADVRVALSDGRRLVLRPRGHSVSVARVGRGTHATVTVRALSPAGLPGRPASVDVK